MSYIRSGSNPEGLYIYGTEDRAYISEGSKPDWFIPLNIFKGLLRKFHRKNYDDFPCSYKGATVDEIIVLDGKEVKEQDIPTIPDWTKQPAKWMVKLSYDGHEVIMWYVTWVYIVHNEIYR